MGPRSAMSYTVEIVAPRRGHIRSQGQNNDLEFNSNHDCYRSADHHGHHLRRMALSADRSQQTTSSPQVGLRLIALGLLVVCLFYFADLVSMYVLPAVTSTQEAMEFMGALHRNLSWLVVLFSMIVISGGYIELGRTQVELTAKNEFLTDLSSKLAKFLPGQLYNSIFTGTHTASVAAQRKKLTIFFSDIANFTGTTAVWNPRS